MKTHWGVKLELHTFLTSALDGGQWSVHDPFVLPAGNEPRVPIGWDPEPVWARW